MNNYILCVDLMETVIARDDGKFYAYVTDLMKDDDISFTKVASEIRQRYIEYSFGNYHDDFEYIESIVLSLSKTLSSHEMILDIANHCLDHYWPVQDSIGFLKECKDNGFTIFAASNFVASWGIELLKRFNMIEYFDGVYISSDIHYRKPAPEFFNYIVNKSEKCTDNMFFIGNSYVNDYLGAQKVGMKPLLLKKNNTLGDGLTYNDILDILIKR